MERIAFISGGAFIYWSPIITALAIAAAVCIYAAVYLKRDGNVFVRRYFFTEPVWEIAKRYNLTENNVMVILSRTRKKLKKHLIKEGFFGG